MNRLLIGIGGAGNNTVNDIIEKNIFEADTMLINTDKEGLDSSLSNNKIFLDKESFTTIEKAFDKVSSKLLKTINNYTKVYVVLGLGGNCGSSTIKLLHQVIKNTKSLVIGIMPFNYEGTVRKNKALETANHIKPLYDEVKLFENQSLFKSAKSDTTFLEAFQFMSRKITVYIKNN